MTMIIEQFKTLAAKELEESWIVKNLLSKGNWTYFVGAPGSGKTMLTIQLCDALQEGKDFLGFETSKENCLYIQADASTVEWKKQINDLAKRSFAWTVHDIEANFCDNSQRVQYLHDLVWGTYPVSPEKGTLSSVIRHIPFTFVVFDCLNKLTDGDLNTKSSMSNVLSKLEYICTRCICPECNSEVSIKDLNCASCTQDLNRKRIINTAHFLLIHHPTKGKTRGTDVGSGYGGFAGVCANMITLSNSVLVLEKCRIAPKQEIQLDRDMSTGAWLLPQSSMITKEEEDHFKQLLGFDL